MRNVVSWKPLVLGASFLLYGAGTAFATETDHLYPTPSTGFMSVQQDGRQINCHIVDKSGPIVGANVVVKGTTIGNISDMDGRAIIENVPANAILVVSYIGYVTQEVTLKSNQTNIKITLVEDSQALDEVVVTGYSTQAKKDITGSVAVVATDELKETPVSNFAEALQGKAAGVFVQAGGGPLGETTIRIRGVGSVNGSDPLIIVDGVQGVDIDAVNANDIESMQILKDASATAIYGARGANGVVLITTKRGKAGENKISYSGYLGTQKVDNPFEFLNAKDYMNLQNALYQEIDGQEGNPNGVYTPSQLQSTVDTDWLDVCTRLALVQDHNIQFRGGSEKTKVLTSLGYYKQEGVLKNTDFNRISGRVNVDQTINDFIKAGATMYAHRERSNAQTYSGNILGENVMLSVMEYDPTVKPYNEDGTYGRVPGGRGDNPLANLLERKKEMVNDKFNGTAFLEVNPFDGFTAKATAGVELLHNFKGSYLPKSTTYAGEIEGGIASTYDFRSTRQVFEGILNYMKTFNNIHDLNVMLGYSYEKYSAESRSANGKGFSTDLFEWNNLGAASIKGVSSSKTENLLASFFGRVNYTFNDKYLATVTVRRDGSSRFGANNHWGTFPSGSLAWRASEEDFVKNWGVFSNLKVRAGYGVTGNERIGDYASYALVSTNHVTLDGSNNMPGTHLNQSSPENASLKWETTTEYNVGFDMGFFNNRLSVTLDGYWKKTKDLLLKVSLPYYTGFTSGQQNVGEISNRGFELDITSHNLTGDFVWDTKFNLALNRNKVLDLGSSGDIRITSSKPMGTVSENDYAIVREGEPLGSLYGWKYIGVLQEGESYAAQPNSKPGDPKFEDVNNDGKIDADDRTIIGNANPDLIFGLTNNFAWKGFDLSIFFQGSIGNDLLNMTRMNLEWKRTTDALNRWTPSNKNTDIPRNGFYYSQYGGYVNDHFIEDASFLRLKNLTLAYAFPQSLLKKTNFFTSARVYLQGQNLLTWTGFTGLDPEVATNVYRAQYPASRQFTLGIDVSF